MSSASVGRRVLLPLVLLVAAFSAVSATAQAWTLQERHHEYFLSPGQTSSNAYNDYIPWEVTGNIAVYEGSGSVGVCQRTYDSTSGVWREGCGVNSVGNALNLTPYYTHWLRPEVKNNSGSGHTIDDYYYFGRP